jgi:hypothetical protein
MNNIINNYILELFNNHGVTCKKENKSIIFDNKPQYKAEARIVNEIDNEQLIVQLDFKFYLNHDQIITESFAGFGNTKNDAINFALQNFTLNSFHVILGTFFDKKDDNITIEEWEIDNRIYKAFLGNIGVLGNFEQNNFDIGTWSKQIKQIILKTKLKNNLNWIRFYYAQLDNKPMQYEALLNNEISNEFLEGMKKIKMPSLDNFYSTRLFMILIKK